MNRRDEGVPRGPGGPPYSLSETSLCPGCPTKYGGTKRAAKIFAAGQKSGCRAAAGSFASRRRFGNRGRGPERAGPEGANRAEKLTWKNRGPEFFQALRRSSSSFLWRITSITASSPGRVL